jgi:proteic killer suppression protein
MIVSFGDHATEDLYHNRPSHRVRRFPPPIISLAWAKFDLLDSAAALIDLQSPPGNRLKALKGDMRGFHSIRVNQQWRIVFRWHRNNAHAVRLVDYHR